jgi:hypothetical protein
MGKSALADRRRRRGFGFPEPIATLRCGPIWDLEEIEPYREACKRDPSSPYRWANQEGRWERHFARYPQRQ